MTISPTLWAIICELSPDEDRRRFARALLGKRIYVGDAKAAAAEFVRARNILLGLSDLTPWQALLMADRAFAALLGVSDPVAASMLHVAARRAARGGQSVLPVTFRRELASMGVAPSRRGPHTDRRLAVLADRVVFVHGWLTGDQPPQDDPYDPERTASGSSLYRLGEAAFRAHGLPWYASCLRKAAQRAATSSV